MSKHVLLFRDSPLKFFVYSSQNRYWLDANLLFLWYFFVWYRGHYRPHRRTRCPNRLRVGLLYRLNARGIHIISRDLGSRAIARGCSPLRRGLGTLVRHFHCWRLPRVRRDPRTPRSVVNRFDFDGFGGHGRSPHCGNRRNRASIGAEIELRSIAHRSLDSV